LQTYEITWESNHVERVVGHQVSWPNSTLLSVFTGGRAADAPVLMIHAEIDGR
jgi:hypothetical protein